jgi:ribosomal protein S18 acetylase RimI-like enzyme|tara:strand:+ start:18 stop:539 length:522 start_codon:yes stop_codon:yes gene_type:complete
MTIDEATMKQLKELLPVYKKIFKTHNVFEKSDKQVLQYMQKLHKVQHAYGGGFAVAMIDDPILNIKNKVVGGICVVFKDLSPKKHMRVALKHLAVDPKYVPLDVERDLIKMCLDKMYFAIKNDRCKSVKVEAHLAESEKTRKLFKKLGFKEEGKLKDHYRVGETCLILGNLVK